MSSPGWSSSGFGVDLRGMGPTFQLLDKCCVLVKINALFGNNDDIRGHGIHVGIVPQVLNLSNLRPQFEPWVRKSSIGTEVLPNSCARCPVTCYLVLPGLTPHNVVQYDTNS